jgi:hypothetical protein
MLIQNTLRAWEVFGWVFAGAILGLIVWVLIIEWKYRAPPE